LAQNIPNSQGSLSDQGICVSTWDFHKLYSPHAAYIEFSSGLDLSAVQAGQSGTTTFMVERGTDVLPGAAQNTP
jgi:hypothetical protein